MTLWLQRICFLVLIVCFAIGSVEPANGQEQTHDHTSAIQQATTDLQQQHHELLRNKDDLEIHYQLLTGSQLLHRVLQEQRTALPHIAITDLHNQIATLRLEAFYLQKEIREQEQRTGDSALILELERQKDVINTQVEALVEYMNAQQDLAMSIEQFAAQLDEYLFWTPSNPPLNLEWVQLFPERLIRQSQSIQSSLATLSYETQIRLTPVGFLFLAGFVLLLLKRRFLKRHLAMYEQHAQDESYIEPSWFVPLALGKLALFVLPGTFALLFLGELFSNSSDNDSLNLGRVFTALAFAWFMLSFMYELLHAKGFAFYYFRWPAETCRTLRHFVLHLSWMLLPVTFVLAFARQQTSMYGQDMLGSVTLLIGSLYLAGVIIWLFKRLPTLYNSPIAHRFVAVLLLIIPLSLFWMVARGYYYTALNLSVYYLATFYVLSLWIVVESSIRQTLLLSARRMHLRLAAEAEHATTRLSEAETKAVEDETNIPLPEQAAQMQSDEAETQSVRLARFFLMIVFGFILFSIWSDALSTLHYLDSQYIWSNEEGISYLPLSIGSMLSAVFIISVSVVLVRNLPGLLEVLVLSRIKLDMGTAYAVTSLTNYVIVSVAVIAVFATLGVSWSQLQWLAAGLTVGLGFGLQEIFGNFISGLILFFERPVRVGDIVTLGELSGRVNQIKIRATVITDFDRRDIIVPNRAFITGQFVNWSLSNTMTRITIRVGVAYGSDLEKTRAILLDIAEHQDTILKDPAPQALFLTFGNSTLDHELRVHVGALSERNPTIDAVNREIDRRFKEAGIEIAFNQIDVHFKNELGVEKRVESRGGDEANSS